MIVSVSLVLLSSSWLPVRVIVCGVLKTVGSKVMCRFPRIGVGQGDGLTQAQRPAPGKSESLVVLTIRLAKTGPALVRSKETGDEPEADAVTVYEPIDVVGRGGDGGLAAGDDGRGGRRGPPRRRWRGWRRR